MNDAAPPSSWLPSAADTTIPGLLAGRPELAERYERIVDALWRDGVVPPRVLELCRLRISMLCNDRLGLAERRPEAAAAGVDDVLVAALPDWASDPRFTAADRAALAVAELFVIDVHAVTDGQVDELKAALGDPAALALLYAFAVFDGFAKMRALLTT